MAGTDAAGVAAQVEQVAEDVKDLATAAVGEAETLAGKVETDCEQAYEDILPKLKKVGDDLPASLKDGIVRIGSTVAINVAHVVRAHVREAEGLVIELLGTRPLQLAGQTAARVAALLFKH